jgi:hypothetical protein
MPVEHVSAAHWPPSWPMLPTSDVYADGDSRVSAGDCDPRSPSEAVSVPLSTCFRCHQSSEALCGTALSRSHQSQHPR